MGVPTGHDAKRQRHLGVPRLERQYGLHIKLDIGRLRGQFRGQPDLDVGISESFPQPPRDEDEAAFAHVTQSRLFRAEKFLGAELKALTDGNGGRPAFQGVDAFRTVVQERPRVGEVAQKPPVGVGRVDGFEFGQQRLLAVLVVSGALLVPLVEEVALVRLDAETLGQFLLIRREEVEGGR